MYESESRRILATLIRLLGDFEVAEDALHDAFVAAAEKWPKEGIPSNPRAWLVSTGRFKAIDRLRRQEKFDAWDQERAEEIRDDTPDVVSRLDDVVEDDQLRLIFTCCHPALASEARTALTLREVCGLTTEEIARAFLTSPPTVAQRIVRAKAKIREAKIPYEIPSHADLPVRLDAVLQVVYLVFNEGYSATSGETVTRADLSAEAIRLGRLLLRLLPEPEVKGLLGLMLLQESRRSARTSRDGDLVLLEDQDRTQWNRLLIEEGIHLIEEALQSHRFGPYTVQGAIAAVHAEAPDAGTTDWNQIVALYDVLLNMMPSPVVELNRGVALAMRDGAEAGIAAIDTILRRGELTDYHLAHSARAELLRRAGRNEEARMAYKRALDLTRQEPERKFLEKRLSELGKG
ncbi:MAG: DNA-directed RNA polymerase sigma-70 factor [Bacteroidia bacterium]|nr:MAG: DNA-directed RNA polymerase sigma-70 factor [Bacteroidia bacterium]